MKTLEKAEIETLIPHRGKMLMLSRVCDYDLEARSLTAEYDVSEACVYWSEKLKGAPAWVAFECMAQSISALSGLYQRSLGREPKIGLILSVLNMKILADCFNGTLRITIRQVMRIDTIYTFDCEAVQQGGEICAQGKLTVLDVDSIDDLKEMIEKGEKNNEQ
jgi:predicted hotdog family 3-hydroxylacyl-ACP dehydratase